MSLCGNSNPSYILIYCKAFVPESSNPMSDLSATSLILIMYYITCIDDVVTAYPCKSNVWYLFICGIYPFL